MFAARGAVVCMALFVVMYCTLSCAVSAGWRGVRRARPVKSSAVLFGLRIFPFAVSALFAIFLTLPSFWLLEGRSLDEDATTFLLAGCALLLVTVGAVRVLRAGTRTAHVVTSWLIGSRSNEAPTIAAMSAAKGAPALILVGVCRPKIMVSDMATAVLSERELQVAVRHELAHKRSWDNLKRLLINATPFPGMGTLEVAWREAAELAADDSAVASRQEALDLASALIKLSRSSRQWAEPELTTGLLCNSSAVGMRVQNLLAWRGTENPFPRAWPWLLLSTMVVAAMATHYDVLLMLTHRLTELIVP
jgi:hypothetical protein